MSESKVTAKAIAIGILATLFLSMSFTANSVIAVKGNHWAWTASLRYFMVIPILAVMLASTKQLKPLVKSMKKTPGTWLRWGNIGFGIFFSLLSYASLLAPGWLVAASFQLTILAGLLIAPFIYNDQRAIIPKQALALTLLLVMGMLTMQIDKFQSLENISQAGLSFILALIAAFLWPLGNRKLLLELEQKHMSLNPMQRVLGMSLGSLPVLVGLAIYGFYQAGLPGDKQILASFVSAIGAGILGGILFYKATQMVKHNKTALATVEATQVIGVFFTLVGEIVFKGIQWPGFYANLGLLIIFIGIALHSYISIKQSSKIPNQKLSSNAILEADSALRPAFAKVI